MKGRLGSSHLLVSMLEILDMVGKSKYLIGHFFQISKKYNISITRTIFPLIGTNSLK